MTETLIIQVPRGSSVERQLDANPPPSLTGGEAVVEAVAPDAEGNLDPPVVGEIVLSVPSPETLVREADEVDRVVGEAGTGIEPLVVVIEDAEALRDDEVASVLQATRRAPRPVILRIIRSR